MISRLFKSSTSQSFFLFGPRGTGKSCWVQAKFPDALYLNLLEDQTYNSLLASPSRLSTMIPSSKKWVIIDEIQRIPALLNEVHRLIEGKRLRFVLTGSSARKLRRGGANLLAGRALSFHAFPFTALELGEQFDLMKALKFGLLPMAYLNPDPKSFLASYVATYLKEEVQQEGLVRNIGNFARFLETASFSQGQILNYSNVSSEAGIERKTVANYFELLEDLLLAKTLEVFALRAKRELLKHRKFFFFDVGVYMQIRPRGPLDSESEVQGPAVETLVLQELLARNEYQDWDYRIYYWRTRNHIEVDFILYGERGLKAIEVKSSDRLREDDFNGLLEFKTDYPKAELFLVYGGTQRKHLHGVEIIPVGDFLCHMDQWL